MNKVLGFCIIFWGKPYMEAMLASIMPQVDHMVLFYTDKPSQGFGTDRPCPDTEEELKAFTEKYGDKIEWIKGNWNNEGDHVNAFQAHTEGYDWAFRIDTDEVLPPNFIEKMIEQNKDKEENLFRVPFIHFWKSFNKICRDGQQPVRLYKLDENSKKGIFSEAYSDNKDGEVYHFGYAIPDKYMRFKWLCSGHLPELKPDWLDNTWKNDIQKDCHPVSINLWNTEDFDKTTLPKYLKDHENYNKEII
jgi:hypothetical protein